MRTHTAQALHDEHMATLRLMERLEALLGRPEPDAPARMAPVLRDIERAVALEIGPHFDFEEHSVFPHLRDAGADEMIALLTEEHAQIQPLALRLATLARSCREAGFTPAQSAEFGMVAADLTARLVSRVQKEEMGMLPVLDDLLDPDTDGALSLALAALR